MLTTYVNFIHVPICSLKERPLSPPPGVVTSNQNQLTATASIPSLPSPQVDTDSPITVAASQTNQNLLGPNNSVQPGLVQNPVFRANVANPQGKIDYIL